MKVIELKKKFKTKNFDQSFSIRIHRSISWISAAQKTESVDTEFLYLWIAFSCCFSSDKDLRSKTEREKLRDFIHYLTSHGHERFYNLFWEKFSGPIRLLIDNVYVFEPFWAYHRGEIIDYKTAFNKSKSDAAKFLSNNDVEQLMLLVIDRLYCLRNQLIHGGATFASKLNRKQLIDANNLLNLMIPMMIDIMMDMDSAVFDNLPITYPVVK